MNDSALPQSFEEPLAVGLGKIGQRLLCANESDRGHV
jgi:hypothetical protein